MKSMYYRQAADMCGPRTRKARCYVMKLKSEESSSGHLIPLSEVFREGGPGPY